MRVKLVVNYEFVGEGTEDRATLMNSLLDSLPDCVEVKGQGRYERLSAEVKSKGNSEESTMSFMDITERNKEIIEKLTKVVRGEVKE